MSRGKHDRLYVGIKGHVLAIDRTTGLEAWRAKLKGSGFVTLHRDERSLFAGTSGELYCIDSDTGRVLWHNPLKGMGLGLMSILGGVATPALSTQYVSVAEHLRRQAGHSTNV